MNRSKTAQLAAAGIAASTLFACTGSPDDAGPSEATGAAGHVTSAGMGGAGGPASSGGTGAGGMGTSSAAHGGNPGPASAGFGGAGTSAGLGGTASGAAGGEGIGAAAGRRAGGDGGASGGQGGAAAGSTGGAGAPASAGGSANGSAGASSGPPSDPIPSEGCGSSAPADPCDTSGSPCTMDVEGTMREYYVVLPDAYEATRPYPVVFQWHPLGGNAEQGMNMYQIRPNLPDAIYVTPDGLASGGNQGFPNTNGGDEKLTRAIIAEIESKYCVDRARYFSTGFSYGSSMSYTCACNMSDVFRAVGSMAGAPISGAKCSSTPPARPVAFWGTHGTEDTALPIDLALPIRDAFIEKNGCSMTTKPVEPSPCVEYEGCSDGYPVVWCPREGDGHSIPTFSRTAIAAFFERF